MVRVKDRRRRAAFYTTLFGMVEIRRYENDKGRFTLVFLAARDRSRPCPRQPVALPRAHLQLGYGKL